MIVWQCLGATSVPGQVPAEPKRPARPVIQVGSVPADISEKSLAALENELSPGTPPWLLVWQRGQGGLGATAFLAPTVVMQGLRRGTLVYLNHQHPAGSENEWEVRRTSALVQGTQGGYAQVAIAGRTFEDIRSDEDANRPFAVIGDVANADVISIAKFIRANKVARHTSSVGKRVTRELPIRFISKEKDSSWTVSLEISPVESTTVKVRKRGATWEIIAVGHVVS